MSRFVTSMLMLLIVAIGCSKGDGLLRTKGRLLKGGQAFIPKSDERIRITFIPIPPDGSVPKNLYIAEVDQTRGTFMPSGGQGKGMPEGKYRVAVELMKQRKDQFEGKFDEGDSPFVVDVTATTAEIVIDLDNPPSAS